jgi:hypothetical protein
MAFCPSCGTAAVQTARFCAACGHPLQSAPPPGINQENQGQHGSHNRTTLRTLCETGCIQWAPILKDEAIQEVLRAVGDRPLNLDGPTGFGLVSYMGSDLLYLFCQDRKGGSRTGSFMIKGSGRSWSLQ